MCCYDNTGLILVDCTGGHATMILPPKGHIIMFLHILQCDKNEQTRPWETDTTVFSETFTHKISQCYLTHTLSTGSTLGFLKCVSLVIVYFPVWPIILVSYSLSKSLIGHTKIYSVKFNS